MFPFIRMQLLLLLITLSILTLLPLVRHVVSLSTGIITLLYFTVMCNMLACSDFMTPLKDPARPSPTMYEIRDLARIVICFGVLRVVGMTGNKCKMLVRKCWKLAETVCVGVWAPLHIPILLSSSCLTITSQRWSLTMARGKQRMGGVVMVMNGWSVDTSI